ncbi:MAG TPA: hypothetical protein ENJ28_05805 [Gammaproteobacteria bacterium]|nr:hypothetical protein [Gammaproteobacteria bacterium]
MDQPRTLFAVFLYLIGFLSSFSVFAEQFDQDFSGQKIIIAGTGDSQKLLRNIARELESKLKGGKIEIPDTVGSTGGIKALLAGRADLARVARPLLENEKKYNLTYLLFAKNPVVFVTHPSVAQIHNLKIQDIMDIYSAKITNWKSVGDKNHKIYPVTREPGDASVKILLKYRPDFHVNKKATKVIFSNPKTIEALVNHKYTLGFLPLSNVKGTNLRVMNLDGISPTIENVQSGKYPLTMPLGIVYKEKPQGLAKVFIDFLYSKKGQDIILDFGAIPIPR